MEVSMLQQSELPRLTSRGFRTLKSPVSCDILSVQLQKPALEIA